MDNSAEERGDKDEVELNTVRTDYTRHQWLDLQDEWIGESNVVPGLQLKKKEKDSQKYIFLQHVYGMRYDAFTDNVAATKLYVIWLQWIFWLV